MKKLLFILSMACMSFLISEKTYAKTMTEREIQLRGEHDDADLRSVPSMYAYLDGRKVYISSYDEPKIVSVLITDMEGEVVVANTYLSPQVISILDCEAGKYQIEIHVDSKVYIGVFELE